VRANCAPGVWPAGGEVTAARRELAGGVASSKSRQLNPIAITSARAGTFIVNTHEGPASALAIFSRPLLNVGLDIVADLADGVNPLPVQDPPCRGTNAGKGAGGALAWGLGSGSGDAIRN
jgi:hypothetical protein